MLDGYDIDGITTHAAELSIEVAKLTEHFDLPGISVWSAEHGTLKEKRIELFKAEGILIPEFEVLKVAQDLSDWKEKFELFGGCAVIKPNDGKGATGVLLVDNLKALEEYYNVIRVDSGSSHFIMEQFLEGTQLSTETVVDKGECIYSNIALRHYSGMEKYRPYLIEDGHSMPWEMSADLESRINTTIAQTARALKIDNGIIKGDLLITDDGKIYVIEMATRTSGGRFADFVAVKQCGVQILYALVNQSIGEELDEKWFNKKWQYGVSQRFILLEKGERVSNLGELEQIRFHPNVEELVLSEDFLLNKCQNEVQSHRDRIGYIITRDNDVASADRLAVQLRDKIAKEIFQYE